MPRWVAKDVPSPMTAVDRQRYQLDIITFAQEILGYRGFPIFQRIILKKMMTTSFLYNSSGYGTGKTMLHAIFAAWRCACFCDSTVGVISHSFRGSKMVFNKILAWYNSQPRFRAEVYDFRKGNDAYTFLFRKPRHGMAEEWSQVRCLPPDFFHNSDRMQSEDWNVGLFDEWTNYPLSGLDAIDNVLMSRTRKPAGHLKRRYPYLPDNIVNNKRIFSSIGGYKFSPHYRKIQIALEEMDKGNPDYWFCDFNYDDYDNEWKELVDWKLIKHQKREMSAQMFSQKWKGQWLDGSGGPYDAQKIDEIRRVEIIPRTRGEKDKVYVIGVDPATPAARSDFALQVLEIDMLRNVDILVYGLSKQKVSPEQMVSVVHETVGRFPGTVLLVCDPGGGGSHLIPMLKTDRTSIKGVMTEVTPLIEYGNEIDAGRPIIVPWALNSAGIQRLFPKKDKLDKVDLLSDADLVNRAHVRLMRAIENRTILSPRQLFDIDVVDDTVLPRKITQEEREIMEHIDGTWMELCMVNIKRDRDGNPVTDSKGFYKYLVPSGHKKDRAYALLYAKIGADIWRKLQEPDDEDDEEFVSEFDGVDLSVISSVRGIERNYYGGY